MEPAAGRRVDRAGDVAGQRRRGPGGRPARAPGSRPAAPACTGAPGRRKVRAGPRSRRCRPRYITLTAVGDVLDDAEVVADEEHGDTELALQLASRFRICACTETSRARHRLVGHDAARARWASAAAIPTRCRWPPDSLRGMTVGDGRVDRPTRSSSSRTRAVPLEGEPTPKASSDSRTLRPTVHRGSSDAAGVLEDGLDPPADLAQRPAPEPDDLACRRRRPTRSSGRCSPRTQRAERALARRPTRRRARGSRHAPRRGRRPTARARAGGAGPASGAGKVTTSPRTSSRAVIGPPRSRPGCNQQATSCRRSACRSRGGATAQRSCTWAHRDANRQPGGGSVRSGTRPGITGRSPDRCVGGRLASRAAPGCTGAAAGRRGRATVPCSTTCPAYITATRSQTWATTPRS